MTSRTDWTRNQLLIAFKLYCQLPFGRLHKGNPEIRRWASLIGRTPSALAMKLVNIASLDPQITGTGRRGLTGASAADRAMWEEMRNGWEEFALEAEEATSAYGIRDDSSDLDVPPEMPTLPANFAGETRRAEINARIGQSFFRRAVLSAYGERCCISGLAIPRLLIASHIAPWKSHPNDRLNPCNGLCLSAIHDRAFDAGLIYLSDDLEVVLSKPLKRKRVDDFSRMALVAYEGKRIEAPKKFSPSLEFVRYHRGMAIRLQT